MDFGAYFRVAQGIHYRRITGLYSVFNDRVFESRDVDILVSHYAREVGGLSIPTAHRLKGIKVQKTHRTFTGFG